MSTVWLGGVTVRLPKTEQSASALNAALGRPPGWLEARAGIHSRKIWLDEDPLQSAAEAVRICLERTGHTPDDVGALLVTAEAPPLLAGLAPALHHRLDLPPSTVALEVGGACTGFLGALWLARSLVPNVGAVLIVTMEAPSRYLSIQPGRAGEAAALFGDGAACAILSTKPIGLESVPLIDVIVGSDGEGADLLRIARTKTGDVELHMEGHALASRAIRTMAARVRDLTRAHGLTLADLAAVVIHGGNGRMPAMLARQLEIPSERVWSVTSQAGNLGSASLPAAWAPQASWPRGPVAWTAVGAGLTWGAALSGLHQG